MADIAGFKIVGFAGAPLPSYGGPCAAPRFPVSASRLNDRPSLTSRRLRALLATLRIRVRLMSAQQRSSIEALTEFLDDLPQVVHVLLDDPQGFL